MNEAQVTIKDPPSHVAFVATMTYQGRKIEVRGIKRTTVGQNWRAWDAAARVYGVLDALAPELTALEPYKTYSIPYAPETADDKVRAAIWNAWKRETVKETARRLQEVLVELNSASLYVDLPVTTQLPKFSIKAGCTMCPCSPGFILSKVASGGERDSRVDLHFSVLEDDAERG